MNFLSFVFKVFELVPHISDFAFESLQASYQINTIKLECAVTVQYRDQIRMFFIYSRTSMAARNTDGSFTTVISNSFLSP